MPHTKKKRPTLTMESFRQAAECLKAIAHPHRLQILQMLIEGSYTVGELAEACEIASPMASEHLRLLQRCGFLNAHKEGRFVYYRVIDPHIESLIACVESRFGNS
jgi:ArsR family transcriptional regulator, zinc-responsive transcriptional repressor